VCSAAVRDARAAGRAAAAPKSSRAARLATEQSKIEAFVSAYGKWVCAIRADVGKLSAALLASISGRSHFSGSELLLQVDERFTAFFKKDFFSPDI